MGMSLFFISAAVLAYELVLMRIFSITQWYHFAYMIISIALLGFGASGSCIALFRTHLTTRFLRSYRVAASLFIISLPGSYVASQQNPFNPFEVVWDARQYLHLFEYYLTLFIPFFFAALCIGLTFTQKAEQIGRVYCFNLIGSGVGSAGTIPCLHVFHPVLMLYIITGVALFGLIVTWLPGDCNGRRVRRIAGLTVLFGMLVTIVGLSIKYDPLKLRAHLHISPYKGLSQALNFPDAQILAEKVSPSGVVHAVSSPIIRHAPGLSLNFQGDVPPQLGLFVDSGQAGSILPVATDKNGEIRAENHSSLAFLDVLSASLAYHLRPAQHVLVLGAGGGFDVVNALYHQAQQVTAVEFDANIIALVRDPFRDIAGGIYANPAVRVVNQEARAYIETTAETYDAIHIALLDSFATSSAGVHALQEDYLYTIEALQRYYSRLTPEGMLSITRWVKFPPRDDIKLFATAVEALETMGVNAAAQHLVWIRSWATCTLLVSKTPFTPEELDNTRRFCAERAFDPNYFSGMTSNEANQYNQLPSSEYYQAAQQILFGDRRGFYASYPYFIRPARDDSPYFFHFFKWKTLQNLLKTMGKEWIPFIEWGFLILLATLVQAGFISFLLILLPFFRGKRQDESQHPGRILNYWQIYTIIYFTCLGLGYLFLEMALIQKFLLFFGNPTYAVAVIIATFLMFSGIGSLCVEIRNSDKASIPWRLFWAAVSGIVGFTLGYRLLLPVIFTMCAGWDMAGRIMLAILLIAPIGFCLGVPFPCGIKWLSAQAPQFIPWAYGINGCASVLSSLIATCIAISAGFQAVMFIAGMLYLIGAGGMLLLRKMLAE